MNCQKCLSILHYHTSGMVCRNCGFSTCHWVEVHCVSCQNELEESEKTSGMCIFCLYDVVRRSR